MFCGLVLCANPAINQKYCKLEENVQTCTCFQPTLKWVYSDLLALSERLIYIFLFYTLYAKVGEGCSHVIVHVDRANPSLAPLLANKVVGMGLVGGVIGHTGDHDHGLARVAHHLDGGEGLVVLGAAHARDASSRSSLALVPEPENSNMKISDQEYCSHATSGPCWLAAR